MYVRCWDKDFVEPGSKATAITQRLPLFLRTRFPPAAAGAPQSLIVQTNAVLLASPHETPTARTANVSTPCELVAWIAPQETPSAGAGEELAAEVMPSAASRSPPVIAMFRSLVRMVLLRSPA